MCNVGAVIPYRSVGWFIETADSAARCGFSAPGLSYQAERLTPVYKKGHVINCFHIRNLLPDDSPHFFKIHFEVFNFNQMLIGHASHPPFAFHTFLRPAPVNDRASTGPCDRRRQEYREPPAHGRCAWQIRSGDKMDSL